MLSDEGEKNERKLSRHFLISIGFMILSLLPLELFLQLVQPLWGFPGGAVVKNPPANAGDARNTCSIPESGRPPGVGNGNPIECSYLENSMGRGAWWATVPGVSKSWT